MTHTFDLMAKDRDRQTLTVEIKWIGVHDGRRGSGPFQRFLGQCVIASSVHPFVLGVCGLPSGAEGRHIRHQQDLEKKLKRAGICVTILRGEDIPTLILIKNQ